jgi:hypothetical protein
VVWVVAACGAPALLSACGSSALSGQSARQVLGTTLTAAQGIGSFDFVDKTGSGTQARVLAGQTGTVNAEQLLSGDTSALDVRLVDHVVYLRAGSEVLESVLGLLAPEASAEAGKWLSVPSGAKGYQEIVETLTPAAELDHFIPQSPLALGATTTLHGTAVVAVTGPAPAADSTDVVRARATLYVSTTAPYLPVGGTLTGTDVHGRTQTEVVVFTLWGVQARPPVPAGAVPVSSLTG